MSLGKALKGKVRRARWRRRAALRSSFTSAARKRQARRTAAFWERKLARYRRHLRVRVASNRRWGGSRAITNSIIDIVGARATVTSRKRFATFGNPKSDHHVSQRFADAVDFGIGEAFNLADEVSRRLGGPADIRDYGSFIVTRGRHKYRVQVIAGTHGTGPHLHFGVRRYT